MIEITLDEIFQINQKKFDTQFQIKKSLAKGSFGSVLLAFDNKRKKEVAIKIIPKKENENDKTFNQFKKEIKSLQKSNHPNIIKLYDFFETKDNVYIEMEYISGGTLSEFMQSKQNSFSIEDTRTIIKYLLNAVDYLHKSGICHRDIKPANIMFSNTKDLSSLKLIDFGLSTDRLTDSKLFCGTVLFMPPERLSKKNYSKGIDIWSIGVIAYMLLHQGNHPFHKLGHTRDEYTQVILDKKIEDVLMTSSLTLYDKMTLIYYNSYAKHFLKKLLEIDPSMRLTSRSALRHPFINQDYTSLRKHIEPSEIEKFKGKLIDGFIAMMFLSQYEKNQKLIDNHKMYHISNRHNNNIVIFNSIDNNTIKKIPSCSFRKIFKDTLTALPKQKERKHKASGINSSNNKSNGKMITLDIDSYGSNQSNKDLNSDIEIARTHSSSSVVKFRVATPKDGRLTPRLLNTLNTDVSDKSNSSTPKIQRHQKHLTKPITCSKFKINSKPSPTSVIEPIKHNTTIIEKRSSSKIILPYIKKCKTNTVK